MKIEKHEKWLQDGPLHVQIILPSGYYLGNDDCTCAQV